jgi:hypothetical protein
VDLYREYHRSAHGEPAADDIISAFVAAEEAVREAAG